MNIELTLGELWILADAMNYALEQYADSNGDIDPCNLNDMRIWSVEQLVDNKRIMAAVAKKIEDAAACAEQNK